MKAHYIFMDRVRLLPRTLSIFIVFASSVIPATAQQVTTSKERYESNESIIVRYAELPGNEGDWITIVPEGTATHDYDQWFWTEGKTSGSMTFNALAEGRYEVRVYYNWPDGGYEVQLTQPLVVSSRPIEDLSDAVDMPEYWDGWDTLEATNEVWDEIAQDKPAEALLKLSMDTIIERMVRERNATKLARLEAVYKRKLLHFMQNTLGLFRNKTLPPITKKEIELLRDAYRYSPTALQRVSTLAESWAGLKRLFGEGVPAYLRKRLGRAVTARLFSRVFGPICVLHDLYTIYEFVRETEELRDAWEGALHSMEQMNCADYDLHYFRSNLTAEEIAQIEALRAREAAYFRSQGVTPPIYPPWQHEIDAACGVKDRREQAQYSYLGCYVDSGARVLNGHSIFSDSSMTNSKCQKICAQQRFDYAGTEYSQECFCGNTLAAEKVADSECNYKCTGNNQEICGGYWRISIYRR